MGWQDGLGGAGNRAEADGTEGRKRRWKGRFGCASPFRLRRNAKFVIETTKCCLPRPEPAPWHGFVRRRPGPRAPLSGLRRLTAAPPNPRPAQPSPRRPRPADLRRPSASLPAAVTIFRRYVSKSCTQRPIVVDKWTRRPLGERGYLPLLSVSWPPAVRRRPLRVPPARAPAATRPARTTPPPANDELRRRPGVGQLGRCR